MQTFTFITSHLSSLCQWLAHCRSPSHQRGLCAANHQCPQKQSGEAEYVIYLSELFAGEEPGVFDTQSTGVKPAYRRLGLALALKVRGLTYAKVQGGVRVTTGMAATNTPIVTLNQRLGFVPEPMWITFHKALV